MLIWTEPNRFLVEEVGGLGDLEGTGLTIGAAEAVHRPVATDDGERTAVDALVRADRPA